MAPLDDLEVTNMLGLTCLTLKHLKPEQSGKYIICIENALGSDSKYVNVTVEGMNLP